MYSKQYKDPKRYSYRGKEGVLSEFQKYISSARTDPDYNEFDDIELAGHFVASKFSHHAEELNLAQEEQLINIFKKMKDRPEMSEKRYNETMRNAYGLAIMAEKRRAKRKGIPEDKRAVAYLEKRREEYPQSERIHYSSSLEGKVVSTILGAGMIIAGTMFIPTGFTGFSILGMGESFGVKLPGMMVILVGLAVLYLTFRKR